jgi:glycolate oxidase iron-sulfur subunit
MKKSQKILLLSGCVQPTLAPNINHSVKNVLIKLGYNPIERINGECCGALDQHLSANETALTKIKRNIDNWLIEGIDTIISTASGCGVMVKDYPKLFDKNDPYYSKAEEISNKTKDIAEIPSE